MNGARRGSATLGVMSPSGRSLPPKGAALLAAGAMLLGCGSQTSPGVSSSGGLGGSTGAPADGGTATGGTSGTSPARGAGAFGANQGGTTGGGGAGAGAAGGAGPAAGGVGAGTGGLAAEGGSGAAPAAGASGSAGVAGAPPLPPVPPSIKIDLDVAGRPTQEVTDPAYASWVPEQAPSISASFEGIAFTFETVGSGSALKGDWYKAGIQAPSYARLVGDGLTVDGGDPGAAIKLTISGLSAGSHTLLTYHNVTQSPDSNTFAPVNISVNGVSVTTGLVPSVRALATADATSSYLTFDAMEGQPVEVLFAAQLMSGASNENLMINGFEVDTPNAAFQAKKPMPQDGNEHVDADDGNLVLSFTAAKDAVSHDVFFGEDLPTVFFADHGSSAFRGNQSTTSFPASGLYSMKTYFWRIDEVGGGGVVTKGNVWYFRPRQLAFPGAEGYGRFARGGRGGAVVHVTNLDDSGPGSLREAIEHDIGPRTVVFDVGGIIALGSRLTLSSKYVTVAGQTAPGKGIVIRSAPFGTSGSVDSVIRHLRVRLGGGPTFDGMGMAGSDHAIIDHCSISWTIDEAFSSRNAHNITLQRTLISEALNIAGHQNYPAGTAHGYAASISGDTGSFHHNLLAHCEGRNWSLAGGLDGNGDYSGRLDIFDNVVYNWGGRSTDGGAHEVNFVNNYYRPGAATSIFVALNAQYDNFPGTQQYFFSGNVMPGYFDENSQLTGRTYAGTPQGYSPWVSSSFFPSYAALETAGNAFKSVLSDVGCTEPVFDDHDVRIVNETLNGTTTYKGSVSGKPGLPDNEKDVGGYESYPTTNREAGFDTDGDGLPDFWETAKGTNPASPASDFSDANADPDGDGFTNLDEYLDWLSKPHFLATMGTPVTIDLKKLFAGFVSSPTYSATGAVGGTVNVSGQTATFTPSGCGFGSVSLGVRDGAGTRMSKEAVFFVSGC